uniref:Uncharacterized protein n=1 Tax=Arundo donax TaxID=35708 RepID=A0A0A9F5F3_ARUDO
MAHCEIAAVPSAHGVPICLMPCQWMTTPSVWRAFLSSMWMVSPARARIVGPGNCPLMPMSTFSSQSGDQNMLLTSHL